MIARAASSPDVDVSKMQALLEMQKDIMATQARANYNAAMSACQAEMGNVAKVHSNTHTKSKYAKLDDIDNVARPTYTKHGFSLSFSSNETPEGFITMKCTVRHRDGHEVEHTKCGWRDDTGAKGGDTKTKVQGSMSTSSYLRRYLTCEVFNIVTAEMVKNDVDGNALRFITPAQREMLIAAWGSRATAFLQRQGLADFSELAADQFDKCLSLAKGNR
ncbi:MAG: ERF family protein [Aeromonas sp.]